MLGIVINGLRAEVSEDFRDLRYYSYYSYGSADEAQSDNPIIRTYQRGKRRARIIWANVQEQASPYVSMAADRLGIDLASSEDQDVEESDKPLLSRIPQILLWTFLTGFVLAGLLWQIGFIGSQPGTGPVREARNVAAAEWAVPSDSTGTAVAYPGPVAPQGTLSHIPEEPETLSVSAPAPEPEVKPPVRKKAAVGNSVGKYYVHTSSHISSHSADRELQRLITRGLVGMVREVDIPGKGLYQRVLIGPYGSKAEATSTAKNIKSSGWAGYTAIRKLD